MESDCCQESSVSSNAQENGSCYPILIGCGDKDIPMELKAVEMWHATEPNSQVMVFKNAGHLVNMDVPSEFNKVVIDFILRVK